MLSSISWSQFFDFIGISLVIYYAWVIGRFYRHDWQDLLPGGRKKEAERVRQSTGNRMPIDRAAVIAKSITADQSSSEGSDETAAPKP